MAKIINYPSECGHRVHIDKICGLSNGREKCIIDTEFPPHCTLQDAPEQKHFNPCSTCNDSPCPGIDHCKKRKILENNKSKGGSVTLNVIFKPTCPGWPFFEKFTLNCSFSMTSSGTGLSWSYLDPEGNIQKGSL